MAMMEVVGIVLLVLGFILIGVEMVVPGFGAPGIGGITCLILGVIISADSVEEGITITIIVIVLLAVMLTIMLLAMRKIRHPLILEDNMKAEPGFLSGQDLEYLVGKAGIASTDLRPSGKCSIDGVEFDVRTEGNYLSRGTKVMIKKIHENTIIVQEIK